MAGVLDALCLPIEPIFEHKFREDEYRKCGFPGFFDVGYSVKLRLSQLWVQIISWSRTAYESLPVNSRITTIQSLLIIYNTLNDNDQHGTSHSSQFRKKNSPATRESTDI